MPLLDHARQDLINAISQPYTLKEADHGKDWSRYFVYRHHEYFASVLLSDSQDYMDPGMPTRPGPVLFLVWQTRPSPSGSSSRTRKYFHSYAQFQEYLIEFQQLLDLEMI